MIGLRCSPGIGGFVSTRRATLMVSCPPGVPRAAPLVTVMDGHPATLSWMGGVQVPAPTPTLTFILTVTLSLFLRVALALVLG